MLSIKYAKGPSEIGFQRRRKYANMRIEDFPEYVGDYDLQGPAPYRPSRCGCDRYKVLDKTCICEYSPKGKVRNEWAHQNTTAYYTEQHKMHHWYYLSTLWHDQASKYRTKRHFANLFLIQKLQSLQDTESPIGCFECENRNEACCVCEEIPHYACSNLCEDYCRCDDDI